jgi:hypothetical protein
VALTGGRGVDFNFRNRHCHCNFLKCGSGHDERQTSKGEVNAHQITLLVKAQEASMGELTSAEMVREHDRGKKAAAEGRSRYWSEPWAYPYESDAHYEARRQAFEQGFDRRIPTTQRRLEVKRRVGKG